MRRQGAAACEAVLEAATPLADALYDLLREAGGDATPEQRAAFLHRLEEAAERIPDKALASEYREALLDRFFAARRSRRAPTGRTRHRRGAAPGPRGLHLRPDSVAMERARILTAILLRHPSLLRDVEHAYAGLELPAPLGVLRDALIEWAETAEILDFDGVDVPPHGFWIAGRG